MKEKFFYENDVRVTESATQKNVTGEVEHSFHQVNNVSKSLLDISR